MDVQKATMGGQLTVTRLHVLYNLSQDTESVLGTACHGLVASGIQLGPGAHPGRLLLLIFGHGRRRRWIRTCFPFDPGKKNVINLALIRFARNFLRRRCHGPFLERLPFPKQ